MIRCKHVADALAATNIEDLPKWRRWAALVHISLCPCCGRFHRDVIRLQRLARAYRDEDHLPTAELVDKKRRQLRELCCGHQHDADGEPEASGQSR